MRNRDELHQTLWGHPVVSFRTPLAWQDDAEQRLGTRLLSCSVAVHLILVVLSSTMDLKHDARHKFSSHKSDTVTATLLTELVSLPSPYFNMHIKNQVLLFALLITPLNAVLHSLGQKRIMKRNPNKYAWAFKASPVTHHPSLRSLSYNNLALGPGK